jgi:hypothetical protein
MAVCLALLQGIAICAGSYPVYVCRADQHQHGGPRCQEVTALGVDAAIERLLLEALTPDRLALAIAALGELDVELENRLVARSLGCVWEDKLRQVKPAPHSRLRGAYPHLSHSIAPPSVRSWHTSKNLAKSISATNQ